MNGCTTVHIKSSPESVRVERHLGVLSLQIREPQAANVTELHGFGITRTPSGWAFGYTSQAWATLGPDCRFVLWVSTTEELAGARELASAHKDICVASTTP